MSFNSHSGTGSSFMKIESVGSSLAVSVSLNSGSLSNQEAFGIAFMGLSCQSAKGNRKKDRTQRAASRRRPSSRCSPVLNGLLCLRSSRSRNSNSRPRISCPGIVRLAKWVREQMAEPSQRKITELGNLCA